MSPAAAAAARVASGRFIVLEGIDGSGTTTQGQALVMALRQAGAEALFTHEPSSGPYGKQLRQLLAGGEADPSRAWDCLALLFAADRLDHVAREIEPALRRGSTVICDRYDLSTLAYQSATAPEAESALPWLRAINARAPRPHLTIVLDVDPDVAERRRAARGGPEELFERRDLQRRLARLYASAEDLVPGDRVVHVSGHGAPPEVTELLLAAIRDETPL